LRRARNPLTLLFPERSDNVGVCNVGIIATTCQELWGPPLPAVRNSLKTRSKMVGATGIEPVTPTMSRTGREAHLGYFQRLTATANDR